MPLNSSGPDLPEDEVGRDPRGSVSRGGDTEVVDPAADRRTGSGHTDDSAELAEAAAAAAEAGSPGPDLKAGSPDLDLKTGSSELVARAGSSDLEPHVDPGDPQPGATEPAAEPEGRRWWGIRPFSWVGCVTALAFWCISLTHSLIPRPWEVQALAGALSLLCGYLLGVLGVWVYRLLGFSEVGPKARRVLWRVLGWVALVAVVAFTLLGWYWQKEVAALIGWERESLWLYLPGLLLSLLLVALLMALARGVRWLIVKLSRAAAKVVPVNAAKATGVLVLLIVGWLLASDTLIPAVRSGLNESFGLIDQSSPDWVTQPTTPTRSGGPGSLVAWDDLGYQGREFIGGGPSAQRISEFTGEPALEPIRAYADLGAAGDLQSAADLVLAELQRTGAFDRKVLVVATTTGRGWINETAASSLEYMWGGDTAIAGMQYSFFPSGVAFLADQRTPPIAGRTLFRTIHRFWSELPAGDRPELYVLGESLGAFGSQGAFGSIEDLSARADGALWVGTPRFTPLWAEITAERDPGSPEALPVLDNCAEVCFVNRPDSIPDGVHPRIVYLQHPTDAVVWWDYDLLFNEPDWLDEGQRYGISSRMRWYPVVTFWQTTLDMILSGGTPDGTGHHYGQDLVDAWALLTDPPGWTAEDTQALRDHIGVMQR